MAAWIYQLSESLDRAKYLTCLPGGQVARWAGGQVSSSCCTSSARGLIQNANMARGAVGSCTWRPFRALKQTNCCPSLSVLSRILAKCCFFTAVCHLAVAQMQSAGNNLSHFLASMIWSAGWGKLSFLPSSHIPQLALHSHSHFHP